MSMLQSAEIIHFKVSTDMGTGLFDKENSRK